MSDLLLLSGGIDSIAIAAWMRPSLCLTVDYGQRSAAAEISASTAVCRALQLQHVVLTCPVDKCSSGLMSDGQPSDHSSNPEFWPFRNQYLITVGAMMAMRSENRRVLIGTVSTDRRHADGTPEFLELISSLLACQEGHVAVAAPAGTLTSFELVRKSGVSNDVLGWAHSCHIGTIACGGCPGCIKHSEVMEKLGWNR